MSLRCANRNNPTGTIPLLFNRIYQRWILQTSKYTKVELKGGPAPPRDHFYWELHEGPSLQAVRFGDWKAVRNGPEKPIELYDLKTDAAESNDLAQSKPDLVAKAAALMQSSRTDHPDWPLVQKRPGKGKKK